MPALHSACKLLPPCYFFTVLCNRLNEEDVKNGEIDVNSSSSISEPTGKYYLGNTTVTVTCDEGYIGGGSIVCGMDVNWTLPMCSPCKPINTVSYPPQTSSLYTNIILKQSVSTTDINQLSECLIFPTPTHPFSKLL